MGVNLDLTMDWIHELDRARRWAKAWKGLARILAGLVAYWRDRAEENLGLAADEMSRLEARVAELEGALKVYSQHCAGCPANANYRNVCTCGLSALLHPTETK